MEAYCIKTSNILENLFKNFHTSFCNTELADSCLPEYFTT